MASAGFSLKTVKGIAGTQLLGLRAKPFSLLQGRRGSLICTGSHCKKKKPKPNQNTRDARSDEKCCCLCSGWSPELQHSTVLCPTSRRLEKAQRGWSTAGRACTPPVPPALQGAKKASAITEVCQPRDWRPYKVKSMFWDVPEALWDCMQVEHLESDHEKGKPDSCRAETCQCWHSISSAPTDPTSAAGQVSQQCSLLLQQCYRSLQSHL